MNCKSRLVGSDNVFPKRNGSLRMGAFFFDVDVAIVLRSRKSLEKIRFASAVCAIDDSSPQNARVGVGDLDCMAFVLFREPITCNKRKRLLLVERAKVGDRKRNEHQLIVTISQEGSINGRNRSYLEAGVEIFSQSCRVMSNRPHRFGSKFRGHPPQRHPGKMFPEIRYLQPLQGRRRLTSATDAPCRLRFLPAPCYL